MFTGIITETGKTLKIKKGKKAWTFTIQTKSILKDKKIGDSIAINGACVTITGIKGKNFNFDAIPETLKLTNLRDLKKGSKVNLEPSLKLNQSLDGHFVQGHIDETGTVMSFKKEKLTIKFPQKLAKYLAFKGSVAINGVSLTISDLKKDTFSVELIPHTLKMTNLGELKKGDKVNLEIDMIARYLERQATQYNKNLKIAIILPYFNESIGLKLLESAKKELAKNKIQEKNIKVVRVAGALEIPFACQKIIQKKKPDAIITLGVIIRGETSHYDLVCKNTFQGIMEVSLKTGVPIVFGVLTTENEKQAKARIDKGRQAAQAALIQASL